MKSRITALKNHLQQANNIELRESITQRIDTRRTAHKLILEMMKKAGVSLKQVTYLMKEEKIQGVKFIELRIPPIKDTSIILIERKREEFYYDIWIVQDHKFIPMIESNFSTSREITKAGQCRGWLKRMWTTVFIANSYEMTAIHVNGFLKLI